MSQAGRTCNATNSSRQLGMRGRIPGRWPLSSGSGTRMRSTHCCRPHRERTRRQRMRDAVVGSPRGDAGRGRGPDPEGLILAQCDEEALCVAPAHSQNGLAMGHPADCTKCAEGVLSEGGNKSERARSNRRTMRTPHQQHQTKHADMPSRESIVRRGSGVRSSELPILPMTGYKPPEPGQGQPLTRETDRDWGEALSNRIGTALRGGEVGGCYPLGDE